MWLSWHSDCTYCEENLIVAGRQEEGSTLREADNYYFVDFFRKRVPPLPLPDFPPKKVIECGAAPPSLWELRHFDPGKFHKEGLKWCFCIR